MTNALQQPLAEAELDDLAAFLAETPNAMPLPWVEGYLTAVVSAPNLVMPSAWQPVVLGDPSFTSLDEAQRILGLVNRLYNQIIARLDAEVEVGPTDDPEQEALWCRGYLAGSHLDPAWGADEYATMLLFPHALLAGEIDLVGEEDADGRIIEDPTPQIERCRARLRLSTLEAYQYWKELRRAPPAPVRRSSPKVGRNDPCPCGSGAKFKKCCAPTLH